MIRIRRICDINGCDRKHSALGLCLRHWRLQAARKLRSSYNIKKKKVRVTDPKYNKQYYVDNKEAISEYKHQWYIKNKEKILKKHHRYRLSKKEIKHKPIYNIEKKNKLRRELYAKNKEKMNEYQRQWREKNRNKVNEYSKVFRARHPEKVKELNDKFRKLNKEKNNIIRKERYWRNKEYENKVSSEYCKNNRKKINIRRQKRRVKIKSENKFEKVYVYVQSESNLYIVGFYASNGEWHLDSDYNKREEAINRVIHLNKRELYVKVL